MIRSVNVLCPEENCKEAREFKGVNKRLRTISTCKCKKCGLKFNPHDQIIALIGEKDAIIEPKKIILELDHVLTDAEKLCLSHELTEALSNIGRCQDNLKSYKAQISSEVSAYEARKNHLVKLLSSGKEMRPTDCEVKYDWKKGIKYIIRKDTGDVAQEGPIPEAEKQLELEI